MLKKLLKILLGLFSLGVVGLFAIAMMGMLLEMWRKRQEPFGHKRAA